MILSFISPLHELIICALMAAKMKRIQFTSILLVSVTSKKGFFGKTITRTFDRATARTHFIEISMRDWFSSGMLYASFFVGGLMFFSFALMLGLGGSIFMYRVFRADLPANVIFFIAILALVPLFLFICVRAAEADLMQKRAARDRACPDLAVKVKVVHRSGSYFS